MPDSPSAEPNFVRRNLIICCDGTHNQFGKNNTNVVRPIQVLNRNPYEQRRFYDPEVGTLPEPVSWCRIKKILFDLSDLAFATGLIAACLIGCAGCVQQEVVSGDHRHPTPPPPTGEVERVIATGSDVPAEGPPTRRHGFPWPPPRASAFDTIPRTLLIGNPAHATLNDAANTLENALSAKDYYEHSYYPVLDGFAIATHIERINDDGTSKKSGRWSLDVPMLETFSLRAYLDALFKAPRGRYRVIVFVVTTHPFTQVDAKVTRQQAKDWLSAGYDTLPDEIARREFSANYKCTALVYEFKGNGKQAEIVDPSPLQGRTHLIKSGLMAALSTR